MAALLAATAADQGTEIPLREFSMPNAIFACMGRGIPSLGIDYDAVHREIDFGVQGEPGQPTTLFKLRDPIKSLVYEGEAGFGRWIIRAEGGAQEASGLVANGTPVRIEATIFEMDSRTDSALFNLSAGTFTQFGFQCRLAPSRLRPGHRP